MEALRADACALPAERARELRDSLEREGFVFFPPECLPFTESEMRELRLLCEQTPRETIEKSEHHSGFQLARFLLEGTPLNQPASDRILEILDKPELKPFYDFLVGGQEHYVGRLQYHFMKENDWVAAHTDSFKLPMYAVTMLVYFENEFSGGDLLLAGADSKFHPVPPPRYSAILLRSDWPHAVSAVLAGERKSLLCFFGQKGRDVAQAFKTPPVLTPP